MRLTACRRAVALAWALMRCMLGLAGARLHGPLTPLRRAHWLSESCGRVLRAVGAEVRVTGAVPRQGLVVSNHLSYLDIASYSSVMPCAFVSKSEVRSWPYFGAAALAAGTIFLDRGSRPSAAAACGQIAQRIAASVPVLLFPEGTTTDGSEVHRFHAGLFQSAVEHAAPVTAAAIRYVPTVAGLERDLCWFGDTEFLPHLWATLGSAGFRAEIRFGIPHVYGERREAANATHAETVAMRGGEVHAGIEDEVSVSST